MSVKKSTRLVWRSASGTDAVEAARVGGAQPRAPRDRRVALATALIARRCLRTLALLVAALASFPTESALASSDIPRAGASSPAGSAHTSGPVLAERDLASCELTDLSIGDGAAACGVVTSTEEPPALPDSEPELDDQPSADPGARSAPMCDNTAASVAAAPEVPEVDRGRIEPVPCDVQRLLARLRSDDRTRGVNAVSGSGDGQPEPQSSSAGGERFDAARASGSLWPAPARSSCIALGTGRELAEQRGHAARIERPPSSG